ncbi:anthranilate phosphoribosyltransferase [Yunchengibacter salinarum]|uniref:anthranilate phosphoribosyltransferase n=1 Tax=Yunchengibacter salinarum TaxID=3133399 RepID=UPI0035B60813
MSLVPCLARLADGATLTAEEAEDAFETIMSGTADLAQMGAFLMALRLRGETVPEVVGGARVLRQKADHVPAPADVVDTCGTGGDGLGTYNISTAAALVASAAGVPVAKHGNRSVSSRSGSADVLQALGADLEMPVARHGESLKRFGFTFMFAPSHHRAMRHVAPVRASLKLRSIFNVLGPLANPAGAKRQVLGVYNVRWLDLMAETLARLGSEHVWVVHGSDGLDELTTTGETHVAEMRDGAVRRFTLTPEDVGLGRTSLDALKGGDAEANATAIRRVLAGERIAFRDIVLLNAGAALHVGGHAPTLRDGVDQARQVVDNGQAEAHLAHWIAFTRTSGEPRAEDREGNTP